MSKELPYFKFYVNEWITGDITLEDFDVQGVFINICAYYWSKGCVCTLTQLKKRFRTVDDKIYQVLFDSKIMKLESNDNITINFLIEQTEDRISQSETNSKNGKKGGRPKKEVKKKPNENPKNTEMITELKPKGEAKKSNIEEIREEEIREEESKEELNSEKETHFIDKNYLFQENSTVTNGLEGSNLYRKPIVPNYDDVLMHFKTSGGTEEMARKFFDTHDSTGWFFKSSPIINFKSLANGYIQAWKKNEKKVAKNDINTQNKKSDYTEELVESYKKPQSFR